MQCTRAFAHLNRDFASFYAQVFSSVGQIVQVKVVAIEGYDEGVGA
jgi:hypothetical protein